MKCCDVEAGKLRHKIELQSKSRLPDGIGGYTIDWETVAHPMAWIRPRSGTETVIGMQLQDETTHDIVIRYKASRNVTPEDRILFGNRAFAIIAVINVEERNRWLQIRAIEGAAINPPLPDDPGPLS